MASTHSFTWPGSYVGPQMQKSHVDSQVNLWWKYIAVTADINSGSIICHLGHKCIKYSLYTQEFLQIVCVFSLKIIIFFKYSL